MLDGTEGAPRPLLARLGFAWRLAEEVARVSRSGGFLSLLLIDVKLADERLETSRMLQDVAERLRSSVRLNDVLGLRESAVAVLLPETNAAEGRRAAERLLRLAGGDSLRECAGLATIFGGVEGGGDALLAAAEDALRDARPGEVVQSQVLAGRPRLLVVDDDLTFAQVLADELFERGWDAYPCSNVEDARQRVLEGDYGGLFVDLMLPGASGIDLLRRSIAAHARRPAVLMSGSDADRASIMEALDLGPVLFIRKPMAPTDLDSALQMFRELLPGSQRAPRRAGENGSEPSPWPR